MTNESTVPLDNSAQTHSVQPEIYGKEDLDRARQEASDKAYRVGYAKARDELSPKVDPMNQPQGDTAMNAVHNQMQASMTPEMQQKIAKDAAAELLKMHQQSEAQKAVSELDMELAKNKDKYPDMENVLQGANFNLYPHAIGLMADPSIPNRADLAYHLAQNPSKKVYLNDLVARGDMTNAIKETRRVADSLMQNDVASTSPQTREPLSQLTPSTGNVSSGGPNSISDYKSRFKGKF